MMLAHSISGGTNKMFTYFFNFLRSNLISWNFDVACARVLCLIRMPYLEAKGLML